MMILADRLFILRFIAASFLALSIGCGPGYSTPSAQEVERIQFRDQGTGVVKPTIYYLPTYDLENLECSSKRPFLTPDGKAIANVCEKQFKECLMQGSCRIKNGKEYFGVHYHSKRGSEYRFIKMSFSNCPFGYSVSEETCLDPYRSVAADLDYFKVGDVILIEAIKGVKLPDGSVHDGHFIVRDTGSAIKGIGRFDFFIGFDSPYEKKNPFVKLGLGDGFSSYSFVLISGDRASQILADRSYPGYSKTQEARKASGLKLSLNL